MATIPFIYKETDCSKCGKKVSVSSNPHGTFYSFCKVENCPINLEYPPQGEIGWNVEEITDVSSISPQ